MSERREDIYGFSVLLIGTAMNELVCQKFASQYKIIVDAEDETFNLVSKAQTVHFTDTDVRVYCSVLRNAGNLPFYITTQLGIANDLGLKTQGKGNSFSCSGVAKSLRRLAQAGYLFVVKSAAKSRYYPLVRQRVDENNNRFTYYEPSDGFEMISEEDKMNLYMNQESWIEENSEETKRRKENFKSWRIREEKFKNVKSKNADSDFWANEKAKASMKKKEKQERQNALFGDDDGGGEYDDVFGEECPL
jgi:hypothetical protein